MQTISHIFSKNKSVRMLKNILTEHTELLPVHLRLVLTFK